MNDNDSASADYDDYPIIGPCEQCGEYGELADIPLDGYDALLCRSCTEAMTPKPKGA